MAENIVVNGVVYNGVDSISMRNGNGETVPFYPDAVRYNAQTLNEAQKAQARKNIGVDDGSGVHIGASEPTNGSTVWIDTDEEAPEPSDNGGSIDVTAEVGQTIVVKAVDENGKPSAWEAVEYQPRTHYYIGTETQTLLDTTVTIVNNLLIEYKLVSLVEGNTYAVTWDGVEYTCVGFPLEYNGAPGVALGNPGIVGGELNDMPFAFISITSYGAYACVGITDGDHTIKITEDTEIYKKLDAHYLPDGLMPFIMTLHSLEFENGVPQYPSYYGGDGITHTAAQTLLNGGRVVLKFTGESAKEAGFYTAEVISWHCEDIYIFLTFCCNGNLYELRFSGDTPIFPTD